MLATDTAKEIASSADNTKLAEQITASAAEQTAQEVPVPGDNAGNGEKPADESGAQADAEKKAEKADVEANVETKASEVVDAEADGEKKASEEDVAEDGEKKASEEVDAQADARAEAEKKASDDLAASAVPPETVLQV